MRYWLHLAGTYSGYGAEIECRRQAAKPGIEWIEFHPADAPHCDKAEHENLAWKEAAAVSRAELAGRENAAPRCDVEGHADLEGKWALVGRKNLELCRRVSELAALLREVAVSNHVFGVKKEGHRGQWKDGVCTESICSRVRAALGGCGESGVDGRCRTCAGGGK